MAKERKLLNDLFLLLASVRNLKLKSKVTVYHDHFRKIEVHFNLVRAIVAADKGFIEEIGFKPNRNTDLFKFLQELSIKK